MVIFRSILSRLYLKCVELDWTILALIAVAHYFTSLAGFSVAGEASLIQDGAFPYYYFTTVSTVGYGDLSPTTDLGRTFFVAYVLPGGLMIFTIVLGKAINTFAEYFRKKANGMGDYSKVSGATVIVGYHAQRTPKMMSEIAADDTDTASNIILITTKEIEAPTGLRYVRADSLSSIADLKRAAVEKASRIVVYADNDDLSLAAIMAVRSLNTEAHLVCYFTDAEKAALLGGHFNAEVIVSASVEMVARELTDPGSSELISDLISVQSGVATFSLQVPALDHPPTRQKLSDSLAKQFGATLISVRSKTSGQHNYDPRSPDTLAAGDSVFYIGEKRIDPKHINWHGSN